MAQAARRSENQQIIDELNVLINLDYDAIKAYEAAIDRLHNPSFKKRLEHFKQDHMRHTQNLAAIVGEYGGDPAGQGNARSVLVQGKVVIENTADDQGIMKAMATNEKVAHEAYQRTLKNLDGQPDIARVIEENLQDECKHKDWMEQSPQAT